MLLLGERRRRRGRIELKTVEGLGEMVEWQLGSFLMEMEVDEMGGRWVLRVRVLVVVGFDGFECFGIAAGLKSIESVRMVIS